MKYIILYEYYSWDIGCGCCSDSSSEVHIWKEERFNTDGAYESNFSCPPMENEQELREYTHSVDPYYDGFNVHPGTVWF
jgi:dihydroorotate dehydrogenase